MTSRPLTWAFASVSSRRGLRRRGRQMTWPLSCEPGKIEMIDPIRQETVAALRDARTAAHNTHGHESACRLPIEQIDRPHRLAFGGKVEKPEVIADVRAKKNPETSERLKPLTLSELFDL